MSALAAGAEAAVAAALAAAARVLREMSDALGAGRMLAGHFSAGNLH